MDDKSSLERIIADCKSGRHEGFDALLGMYANRCYGYFYRLTGDPGRSNDLLSELFLRLVRKIGQYKSGSFEKWLFTVASNIFRDDLRQKYRDRKLIQGHGEELALSQNPKPSSDQEVFDKLDVCLERLDTETRELLMMRYYGKFSFRELSEMRSEPIGTTLARVHRGLKRMRELMERNDG